MERCEESDSGLPALVRDHPIRQVGVPCLSLLFLKGQSHQFRIVLKQKSVSVL